VVEVIWVRFNKEKAKPKIRAMAATAAALFLINGSLLSPSKSNAQDLSMQIAGTSYKNSKEHSLSLGFSSKKPLSSNFEAGFDLSLAISSNPDIVESYQFQLAYNASERLSITPYFWKDRFYGVDPYAVGMVVSIGKLNLIAEYEAPKTDADPKVWAEGISYGIGMGKFTLTPKLIFSQLGDKVVDVLGGEIKLSYDADSFKPFAKAKTLGFLSTGACSTNLQAGLSIPL